MKFFFIHIAFQIYLGILFPLNPLQQQQHQKIISMPEMKLKPKQSPNKPPVLAT